MGYTHYWTFKQPAKIKGNADLAETRYLKAIAECAKIARAYNDSVTKGSDQRLSGFSAHTKSNKYGGLEINGKGENGHETFAMREHFRQNFEPKYEGQTYLGGDFCKTARKPYDIVVTACLALLKHRLGDLIEVSSDGNANDWLDGIDLARSVTGLAIKNPIVDETPQVETPKPIDVTLRKFRDGETFISLTELQKLIKSNVEGFRRGTVERATLEVFADKIKNLS